MSAPGWQSLLNAINTDAGIGIVEPSAMMPGEQFATLISLPGEIEQLVRLRELRLYGSHLRRLPAEVGRLTSLASLDVYTSYSLHWLPYEITRCHQLVQTRMSTRALYGNAKTRLPFPRLSSPMGALTPNTCSVCDNPFNGRKVRLFWTTQRIGTDVVPLLIHACSDECLDRVPSAPPGYHPRPHKGGGGIGMPDEILS